MGADRSTAGAGSRAQPAIFAAAMSELDEQIANRRAKREALAERGIDAYPIRFAHDLEPSAVHERHGGRTAEELEAEPLRLSVPGRVRSIRRHGKAVFIDLADGAGSSSSSAPAPCPRSRRRCSKRSTSATSPAPRAR
jgi:lysyl-tRNA synthetase class II